MTPLPLSLDGYFYYVWHSQVCHTYRYTRTLTVQPQNVVCPDSICVPASLTVNEETSLHTLCFLGILCTYFRRKGRNLLLSGSPALAGYSMLSPSEPEYYAASSIADIEKKATRRLQNYQKQCAVELWRYSPEKLAVFDKASNNKRVDRLSLALALRDDNDDRIQEAVDEMLDSVWRDIGCRQD